MAGAVFTNESTTDLGYFATLLNTRGAQIFTNPNQITEALNANASLGGNFQHTQSEVGGNSRKNYISNTLMISVVRRNADNTYRVSIHGLGGNETPDMINAVKSVISGEAAAPAGAARRRRKTSRRRRLTRRR